MHFFRTSFLDIAIIILFAALFIRKIQILLMSLHAFEKIAKKAGVKRISGDGVEELRDTVEEYGMEIAIRAVQIANHRNCRTVQKKDVEFVSGNI